MQLSFEAFEFHFGYLIPTQAGRNASSHARWSCCWLPCPPYVHADANVLVAADVCPPLLYAVVSYFDQVVVKYEARTLNNIFEPFHIEISENSCANQYKYKQQVKFFKELSKMYQE